LLRRRFAALPASLRATLFGCEIPSLTASFVLSIAFVAAFGAAFTAALGAAFAFAVALGAAFAFGTAFSAAAFGFWVTAFGFEVAALGFAAALAFAVDPRFAPVPGPRRDWPLPADFRALAPLARAVPVDWRELLLFEPLDAAAAFVERVDFDAFFGAGCFPLPFEEDERPADVLRRRVVVCAMSA
jgi:hypothetical protein